MVTAKLGHKAGDHELEVCKCWDAGLYAGGLVEEGRLGIEEKVLCVCVCVCVCACVE